MTVSSCSSCTRSFGTSSHSAVINDTVPVAVLAAALTDKSCSHRPCYNSISTK